MSFWRTNYHLVWATKNREPLIQPEFETQLFGYIVNKGAELGVYTHAIGGCADHIHLIVSVPPKHAVAQVVKTLKGASSFYVNHVLRPANLYFAWQHGYGCLTIGEKQRPARTVAAISATGTDRAFLYLAGVEHQPATRDQASQFCLGAGP